MKIYDPTFEDLRKMDDLLVDIKEKSFLMRINIRDEQQMEFKEKLLYEQLNEKNSLIEQLENLVREWSYVPLCAACYLKEIPITRNKSEPAHLSNMDDIILKLQFQALALRKYKRNAKRDAYTLRQIEDTKKTKLKLINSLRTLTETWEYIPMCAADLLET